MKRIMKVLLGGAVLLIPAFTLPGCGGEKKSASALAEALAGMNDAAKIHYMMNKVTPDSVARFICDASLGRLEGVKIDTLSMAALYAYENYKDEDLQSFQAAFDAYAENLQLPDKMKLRKLAASDNPDALGYQLGLEYVDDIRTGKMSSAQVESEIAALKKVCEQNPEDSLTFHRFMTGFKVALDQDAGNGVPRQIYEKYK